MIGQLITGADGKPLAQYSKLSQSQYNPPQEVKELFNRVQRDYQVSYGLQHRPFKEFDGYSLLDRARLDQETFGAYVGCEWVPKQKAWRWKGRKNTSRNKLIQILARTLAGMLYPYVYAQNEMNEEDKMSARVMRILIEEHLRKANYEMKFLFLVSSALVNPAVFCEVEYVEAFQKVKQKLAGGKWKIIEVVDELLSGLQLNVLPIDEILLPDYYSGTGQIQKLPNIIRVRRISYDTARAENAGKYFDDKGKDLFDYVRAGQTRVLFSTNENLTLYDVEWTEADGNYVQEVTAYYRAEDLEVKWIAGVGMFNYDDCYNTNPFEHRRMILTKDEGWCSIPVYKFAMSGFEPLDPAGRFAWYKSGAFKEYWDDQGLNRMWQLAFDGTSLDVIKPQILSGVAKVDGMVMSPGAVFGLPAGAQVTPYSMGPNLAAAYQALTRSETDISASTQSDPAPATATPNVSATQTAAAVAQSRLFFNVFALMLSDLINQIGGLVMDCTIQYSTIGDLDISVPGTLNMKYKTFLSKGKDKGKNVSNKIIFTDKHMGRKYNKDQKENYEWDLYNKSGGTDSDQRIYEVNPYAFARTTYSMYADADQIVLKSTGADRAEKALAFNMMADPRVAPFTDPQAVATDFVIEEYGGDDPDRYKRKGPPLSGDMLNAIMNQGKGGPPGAQAPAGGTVMPPGSNPPVPALQ